NGPARGLPRARALLASRFPMAAAPPTNSVGPSAFLFGTGGSGTAESGTVYYIQPSAISSAESVDSHWGWFTGIFRVIPALAVRPVPVVPAGLAAACAGGRGVACAGTHDTRCSRDGPGHEAHGGSAEAAVHATGLGSREEWRVSGLLCVFPAVR